VNTDHDRTLTIVVQTLHDWWASMGALAWVLLGVAFLIAITAMLFLLRWIWRGGLSRQTSFGFLHRHQFVDEASFRDS